MARDKTKHELMLREAFKNVYVEYIKNPKVVEQVPKDKIEQIMTALAEKSGLSLINVYSSLIPIGSRGNTIYMVTQNLENKIKESTLEPKKYINVYFKEIKSRYIEEFDVIIFISISKEQPSINRDFIKKENIKWFPSMTDGY